jgi:hypothetical protein
MGRGRGGHGAVGPRRRLRDPDDGSPEMLRPARQGDARGGCGELGDGHRGWRRWLWRRSGRRLGEEASQRGAWVAMAQPLCGGSAQGGSAGRWRPATAPAALVGIGRSSRTTTRRDGEKDDAAAALTRQHLQRLKNGGAARLRSSAQWSSGSRSRGGGSDALWLDEGSHALEDRDGGCGPGTGVKERRWGTTQ